MMYYCYGQKNETHDLNRKDQVFDLIIANEFVLSKCKNSVMNIDFNNIIDIYIYNPILRRFDIVNEYPKHLSDDTLYLKTTYSTHYVLTNNNLENIDTVTCLIQSICEYNLKKLTSAGLLKLIEFVNYVIKHVHSAQIECNKIGHKYAVYSHQIALLDVFIEGVNQSKKTCDYLSFLPAGSVYINVNLVKSHSINNEIIEMFYQSCYDIIKDIGFIEKIDLLITSCEYQWYRIIGYGYCKIVSAVNGLLCIDFDTKGNLVPSCVNMCFETSFMKHCKSANYLHLYILDIIISNIKQNIIQLMINSSHCDMIELHDINEILSKHFDSNNMYMRQLYHWFNIKYSEFLNMDNESVSFNATEISRINDLI